MSATVMGVVVPVALRPDAVRVTTSVVSTVSEKLPDWGTLTARGMCSGVGRRPG